MKRYIAMSLIAATALTLNPQAAYASKGPKSSSEVTNNQVRSHKFRKESTERWTPGSGISGPYKKSSENEDLAGIMPDEFHWTFKNDAFNNYRIGTTWDLVIGLGITAGVLVLLGSALTWAGAEGILPIIQLTF